MKITRHKPQKGLKSCKQMIDIVEANCVQIKNNFSTQNSGSVLKSDPNIYTVIFSLKKVDKVPFSSHAMPKHGEQADVCHVFAFLEGQWRPGSYGRGLMAHGDHFRLTKKKYLSVVFAET